MAQGKVALVTGGGSGIGRSAALALQGDGWNVVVTGRRKEELDKTIALAKEGGGKMVAVAADVGKPEDVQAPVRRDQEGVRRPSRFPVQQRRLRRAAGADGGPAVRDVEIGGRRHPARLVPVRAGSHQDHEGRRRPKGGRIVNNGSISAHTPRPNSVAYTSSKHAITGLTKCIALDGRKHDIACGQLDIGNADTAMGGRMKAGVPQANGTIAPEAVFDVEHCGSAIRYMASLPLDTNVLFMNIKATKMPFEGRG